ARDARDIATHFSAPYILGNELIVDPALPMTGDFEAAPCDLGSGLGIALQRHADRVHGRGCAHALQQSHDFPESHATAVFEVGLHVQVARAGERLDSPEI